MCLVIRGVSSSGIWNNVGLFRHHLRPCCGFGSIRSSSFFPCRRFGSFYLPLSTLQALTSLVKLVRGCLYSPCKSSLASASSSIPVTAGLIWAIPQAVGAKATLHRRDLIGRYASARGVYLNLSMRQSSPSRIELSQKGRLSFQCRHGSRKLTPVLRL